MEVMTMKGYFKLPKAPELKPHHQIQFSVILWTQQNCMIQSCQNLICISIGFKFSTMNLADSTCSQDNIYKVVSQEREKGNLLPVDRMTDISVCR